MELTWVLVEGMEGYRQQIQNHVQARVYNQRLQGLTLSAGCVCVCIRKRVCVWVCENEEGLVLKTLRGAQLLSDSTCSDNNTLAALCVYRLNSEVLHNHFLDGVLLILPTLASTCLLPTCCQPAGQLACLPACQADVDPAVVRIIKEGK